MAHGHIETAVTESGFQIALRQARSCEEQSGLFMGPSARLIVEALSPQPGDLFLDLACGTGLVARHAWDSVGPGGRVVGVDVNPAMLAAAKSICSIPGIEWLEASADALPCEAESFTHAACQQGLQFFPDPAAAVREVHRVLRPGRSFVATVWATPGHNPYIEAQLSLLSELEESVAVSAQRATPANADEMLVTLTNSAGFAASEVSLLEHSIEVADVKSFFLAQTASTPWALVIAGLSPQERIGLAADFAARLQPDRTASGGQRLSFGSHLLTARK
jgi:ubiquinone/menaquinone biosynthesis C-methylase UbiE